MYNTVLTVFISLFTIVCCLTPGSVAYIPHNDDIRFRFAKVKDVLLCLLRY